MKLYELLETAIQNKRTMDALKYLDDPDLVNFLCGEPEDSISGTPGYEAMLSAARRGELEVLNKLLTIPAISSKVAYDENRVLGTSVLYNQFDVFLTLLEIPAVINELNNRAPLIFQSPAAVSAAENKDLRYLKLLLDQPGVLANEKQNRQAYEKALQYDNFKAVEIILSKCADEFIAQQSTSPKSPRLTPKNMW